jgi:hypothetical protein
VFGTSSSTTTTTARSSTATPATATRTSASSPSRGDREQAHHAATARSASVGSPVEAAEDYRTVLLVGHGRKSADPRSFVGRETRGWWCELMPALTPGCAVEDGARSRSSNGASTSHLAPAGAVDVGKNPAMSQGGRGLIACRVGGAATARGVTRRIFPGYKKVKSIE